MYVLKNSNGDYVTRQKNSKRCITSSMSKAETYDTLLKATNVKNCLPSTMRNREEFFPLYIEEERDEPILIRAETEVREEMEKVSTIPEILSSLNSNIEEVIQNKTFYQKRLSELDQEVCDIYHFIENAKLNARDGYKVYKMLHDKLQQRREIKNFLIEIDMLTSLRKKTKKAQNKINGIGNRQYTPRRLNHLFEQGV